MINESHEYYIPFKRGFDEPHAANPYYDTSNNGDAFAIGQMARRDDFSVDTATLKKSRGYAWIFNGRRCYVEHGQVIFR